MSSAETTSVHQEALEEMKKLAIALNFFGIKVHFESNEVDKHGVRILRKLNAAHQLTDDYARDLTEYHEDRPEVLSLTSSQLLAVSSMSFLR